MGVAFGMVSLGILRNITYSTISKEPNFLYNIGSGGTGYHVVTQRLRTAGFILSINKTKIYVDPGIGSLISAIESEVNFEDIDAVFVSHAHIDHSSDAEGIIECIFARSMYRKKPLLIASPCVLGLKGDCNSYISKYHLRMAKEVIVGEVDKKIAFEHFKIKITPALHHKEHTIGFVLETDKLKIAYTSDTAYFESFEKYYKGVDILIAHPSVLRRNEKTSTRHASFDDIVEMLASSNPKYVLLRHIGYEILQYGIENFINDIKREFLEDIEIYALLDKDGVIFEI